MSNWYGELKKDQQTMNMRCGNGRERRGTSEASHWIAENSPITNSPVTGVDGLGGRQLPWHSAGKNGRDIINRLLLGMLYHLPSCPGASYVQPEIVGKEAKYNRATNDSPVLHGCLPCQKVASC